MSKELFQALLNKEFYQQNKSLIVSDLFEREVKDLFETLRYAYDNGSENLSTQDLKILYERKFPAETQVKRSLANKFLDDLAGNPPIQNKAAELALKMALKNNLADQAATLLIQQTNYGKSNVLQVRELLREIESLEAGTDDNSKIVDMDIDYLLQRTALNSKWLFNIPAVSDLAGGVGAGVFCLIAGRVNSGKSLASISFCFGPGGFADQGAKVLYLCNEEHGAFTGLRAVSCYTGMTRHEILADRDKAREKFKIIKDRVIAIDDPRMSMAGIEKLCEKYTPDIVVCDMLDHVKVGGDYAREDQRLGQLYRQAREIAKIHNCCFIGVSQTSAESDGKLHYGFDALANSKTDKPAACDLILLLGAEGADSEGNYNPRRAVNVAKNKITGKHGSAMSIIQPELSRLVA